jgi:asparagine synthase (glutamine-hydrolysing)
MCGIVGALNFNKHKLVDEKQLTIARDTLIHRGPDFGANFFFENFGLAHRRLSIIDLSNAANQPMISQSGRFAIVYNGEIYNYKQLRMQLQSKGYHFQTSSDTEVLLNMFECYGADMLQQLNGMFALAILDMQERTLFLARDRVGIKPLYFYYNQNQFVFASEAKALFRYGIDLSIDENYLNEFLFFRFVSGPNTIFKKIQKLQPGHYLVVKENQSIQTVRWWHLAEQIQNHPQILNPLEWFTDTFNSSIANHMISDVPVGILLSGGLDSSSIAASLHHQGFLGVKTFNVEFRDFADDESQLARALATKFNFPFASIHVEGDELAENLSIANYMHDEPLVHENEPQLIAISRYAKKSVSVLLSGEGADEFLGGYVRYRPLAFAPYRSMIKLMLSVIPHSYAPKRLQKLERYFKIASLDEMILYNSLNNYPNDYKKLGVELNDMHVDYRLNILQEAKHLYPNNAKRQAMYLDQHTYLNSLNDRNDRATMAASIECRVPFLDHRLMEGLGKLDDEWFFKGRKGKFILKESFSKLLPESTLQFRKVGFSVPWIDFILKSQRLKYHWDTMEQCELFEMGMLKLIDVAKLRSNFKYNSTANQSLLRQLFFMSLWWKQYVEHFKDGKNNNVL